MASTKHLREWLARFLDQGMKRFLRDSSWAAASSLGTALLGLVQVAALSRALGRDRYGLFVLVANVALTVRQFLSVRAWEWTTVDYAAAYKAEDGAMGASVVRAGLALSATINAASLGIVVALAPWFAARFLQGRVSAGVVALYALTLVASWSYDTCFAMLRIDGQFRYLAAYNFVSSAVRVVVLLAVVLISPRLSLVIAAYVLFEFATSVRLLVHASASFRRRFGRPWWRGQVDVPPLARLRNNWRVLVVGSAVDTMRAIASRLDLLALGWWRTPGDVAVYQAAYNFIDAVIRLVAPVAMVSFADVAKIAADRDADALMRYLRRTAGMILLVVLPIALVLFLGADVWVGVVYGRAYSDAATVLRILAFGLVWTTAVAMQPTFVSIGKAHWGLAITAVVTTVKFALLAALVPKFGPRGLATANLVHWLVFAAAFPLLFAPIRRAVRTSVVAAA